MERVRNPLDTDAAAQTYDIAHGPHIRIGSRIPHAAGLFRSEQQSLQAVRHALAFSTWRSLTQPRGGSDDEAVALTVGVIEDARRRTSARGRARAARSVAGRSN